jgi:hypothetical protein
MPRSNEVLVPVDGPQLVMFRSKESPNTYAQSHKSASRSLFCDRYCFLNLLHFYLFLSILTNDGPPSNSNPAPALIQV